MKVLIADMVASRNVIIELKVETHWTPVDETQLMNYLKATGMGLGFLFNFGWESLEWKRFGNTESKEINVIGG